MHIIFFLYQYCNKVSKNLSLYLNVKIIIFFFGFRITDENPYDKAQNIAKTGFQTPIDEQEASSRYVFAPKIEFVEQRKVVLKRRSASHVTSSRHSGGVVGQHIRDAIFIGGRGQEVVSLGFRILKF